MYIHDCTSTLVSTNYVHIILCLNLHVQCMGCTVLYAVMYSYPILCMCIYYVGDGYTTRPVLKAFDGFKAGRTASTPARRLANSLQYQPTALLDGFKYVWTALKRALGFKSIPNIYIRIIYVCYI